MEKAESNSTVAKRLVSLDVLRGFDMFFITGGGGLLLALCAAFGAPDCLLARQLHHVPWAGLAFEDTIFPLFLFLAGVSWPFSLASQLTKGKGTGAIVAKVIRRAVALFLLGFVFCNGFNFPAGFRIPGVLNFIGPCWGLAALIFLFVKKPAVRLAIPVACLLAYWALLAFVPAPGAPVDADTFSKQWNIVSWLDRTILPNHIYVKGVYDPESFFAVPGGVSMALLGMLAGSVLKTDRLAPMKKFTTLLLGAAIVFALDLIFIHVLGDVIVKALWTSSFVLSAATYGFVMLAIFYWVIDIRGWKGWTLYFKVIGMNSITVYMLQRIAGPGLQSADRFFFGGLAGLFPEAWGGVVTALGYLAVVWAILYFLYRKNVFLRV